jgi:formyltetrahydrofolate synthetase
VLVATVRALKMHGGVAKTMRCARKCRRGARGLENLRRHVANLRLRRAGGGRHQPFDGDTPAELETLCRLLPR